jgi:hypothetical protein
MQDLPEIFPYTPAQTPAPKPIPTPHQSEVEGLPEPDCGNLEVMEEVEEGDSGDHCLRHDEGISNDSADHAQPQSESNGELRDDEATKAAKGAYIAAPNIEEVRSAHAVMVWTWFIVISREMGLFLVLNLLISDIHCQSRHHGT